MNNLETVKKFGLMVPNIMDNSLMGRKKVKVNSTGLMEAPIKVRFLKTASQDKEPTNMQMEEFTLENGKKIKCMEREPSLGLMAKNTLVITS